MDTFDRWCLFCDLEVHPAPPNAPRPILDDYIDDLIALTDRGEAKRIFEHNRRVTRIAQARRVTLQDGSPAVAMVITLGDRQGADPAFIHFDAGAARVAEKLEGEVKGYSAHCILRLTEDDGHVGRYRMLLEEVRGIGRTPVTRLLGKVLTILAEDRGEQFRNPETGRMNKCRPVAEVHPRQSSEMAAALGGNSFLPVELFDTSRVPAFDERPEFKVRRHQLTVKVKPAEGRTIGEAIQDLAALGRDQGYDRMRVSWRVPGEKKGGSAEMATDLADIGTALFAQREMVHIEHGLAECSDRLNDEFVAAMQVKFG